MNTKSAFENKRELQKIIDVLEVFRDQDPDITLPSMLAFCHLAMTDGQSNNQYHMEQALEMSGATASRAAAHWFKMKRKGHPGQDFMYSEVDPEDRRYRVIYLNHRGQQFVNKLADAARKMLPKEEPDHVH